MTQNEELESLRMTNKIQDKILKARGDELVNAILILHKLLPLAKKAKITVENPDWLQEFEDNKKIIEEAEKFLHDER